MTNNDVVMSEPPNSVDLNEEKEEQTRFELELEFVQLLSNPYYLQYLAQRGFFKDPAFINYLAYLQYWKRPEYAKYILYPFALSTLTMLQDEKFRNEIAVTENAQFLHQKQFYHWTTYKTNRNDALKQ